MIFTYSTIDRSSFEDIKAWKSKIDEEITADPLMCIVQTKIDLQQESVITK